jgi:hypothetical protein
MELQSSFFPGSVLAKMLQQRAPYTQSSDTMLIFELDLLDLIF